MTSGKEALRLIAILAAFAILLVILALLFPPGVIS